MIRVSVLYANYTDIQPTIQISEAKM